MALAATGVSALRADAASPAFWQSGSPAAALVPPSYASAQPSRDPVLGDLRIDVSSTDPAHQAERVGKAANLGLSSLSLSRPVPLFAPPAQRERTLVGIDTWFWVSPTSWRPVVRVVAAGAVVVTLVATPAALQLIPGDGSLPVTCPGPGMPWLFAGSRSPCSHRYQRASTASAAGRYRAVVQSVWMIRWTSNTGLSGVVGPVVVPTTVSLLVAEGQAVLVR